ncbi:MAG: hypothetical protein AB7D51_05450 [Desulfovibrionaceae bacterium]
MFGDARNRNGGQRGGRGRADGFGRGGRCMRGLGVGGGYGQGGLRLRDGSCMQRTEGTLMEERIRILREEADRLEALRANQPG